MTHSFPTRRSSDLAGFANGSIRANRTESPPLNSPMRRPQNDRGTDQDHRRDRSEEHTSALQSLMRISYAVICLKQKNTTKIVTIIIEKRTNIKPKKIHITHP